MRQAILRSALVKLIGLLLILAFQPDAAAQAHRPAAGEHLPVHAVLSIRARALPREGCSGHGFIVVWEGDLEPTDDDPEGVFPARYNEAFDARFATLKFDDWVCRSPGLDDVRFTHKLGRRPSASVRLVLVNGDAYGKPAREQWVDVEGFELGYVHVSGDVTEPGAILLSAELGAGDVVPALELTEEDFQQGFTRTYHNPWDSDVCMFAGYCDYEGEATLTLSYKQDTDKPKVEVAGCADLLPGGSRELTATGSPSGGRYRWSADTPSVLSASGSDSSTTVKAGEPGHASVRVEYEARNGKKAEATIEGSVVMLKSVNGGAAIPTIYLYDAYGNEKAATQVPIAQEPPDGTLLEFVPADPSVISVENMGSSLLLQGLREGTTSAQAQTRCGEKTGPVITVKVANEVVEAGNTAWTAYQDGVKVTAIKLGIVALGGPFGATAVSAYEKGSVVYNFLRYTEALLDADERVQREQPIQKGYSQELDQIDKLIEKCKKGSGGGQPPAPQQPPKPPAQPPKPPAPKPAPTQPAGPTTPSTPPTQPTGPTPPSGGGQTPPPPPPPTSSGSGGGTVGLPLECGCDDSSTAEWRKEDTGLAAIAAGLTCLKGHAEDYGQALETFKGQSPSMQQAMSAMEKALDTPGDQGFELFRAAVPGLEAATKTWEDLTKASETFAGAMKGCDKKVPEAAGLIRKNGEGLTKSAPGMTK